MRSAYRLSGLGALAVVMGLGAAPDRLEAQLDWTSASTVETAGDDVTLIYTQLSVKPDRRGFVPVASVSLYRLETASGGTWSTTPAVGMEYRARTGMVSGKVGYSFKSDDVVVPFFGGSGSGVTTSLHGEHWGTGQFGLQGIGSYNWGSDYLWSRARGTARVSDLREGALHVGAEYVWQGELDSPAGATGYRATQFGPVVQYITRDGGPIVAVGGGWKDDNLGEDDTWYAKAELVLSF